MKNIRIILTAATFIVGSVALMGSNPSTTIPFTYSATVEIQQENQTQTTLNVQGSCEMCKKKIEATAKKVKGVKSAVWNQKEKTLQLEYNSSLTSVEAISKAIAAVGYDTEKDKADQKVYDKLPACCKYR